MAIEADAIIAVGQSIDETNKTTVARVCNMNDKFTERPQSITLSQLTCDSTESKNPKDILFLQLIQRIGF